MNENEVENAQPNANENAGDYVMVGSEQAYSNQK
jgi:hypothetical protein